MGVPDLGANRAGFRPAGPRSGDAGVITARKRAASTRLRTLRTVPRATARGVGGASGTGRGVGANRAPTPPAFATGPTAGVSFQLAGPELRGRRGTLPPARRARTA